MSSRQQVESLYHDWLALAIGNSRLHWGWFDRAELLHTWDTPHLRSDQVGSPDRLIHLDRRFDRALPTQLELWIASVVPPQTALWQSYPQTHTIALSDIPLQKCYSTLGIDRALAAWSAAEQFGLPVLVIDGGTALTVTGVNAAAELVGGAIWPGLRLQMRSLSSATAALPEIDELTELPPRWATETIDAVRSGVFYSAIAGLRSFVVDWQQQHPHSAIVLTGGDGAILRLGLQQELAQEIAYQPHLLLDGIARCRSRLQAEVYSRR